MSKELIWGQNLEIDFWLDFSEWLFNPSRGFSGETGYGAEILLPPIVFDYFHIKLNEIDYYKKPQDWKPSDDVKYVTELVINTPFGKLILKEKKENQCIQKQLNKQYKLSVELCRAKALLD